MDDIEKRIELKNLEIKKLRLEQELSNLSNNSNQEPQNTQNTQKASSHPNNNYNKPNNVRRNRLRFLYFTLCIAGAIAIAAVIMQKDHILLSYDKAVIADIQGTWFFDKVRDDDLIENTIYINGNKYEAWAKQLSLDKKTVISQTRKESGTISLNEVYTPDNGDEMRNLGFMREGYKYDVKDMEDMEDPHFRGLDFISHVEIALGNELFDDYDDHKYTKIDKK